MREISFQTMKRIFELHFKGYPRDVKARKVGVSTGTVSNVIDLLPHPVLDELRALSVELRKSGKSPHEALKGAKLLSKLNDIDIELDQLPSFIHMAKKLSKGTEYQPKQLVEWGTKLSDLEQESGKSYVEAIQEFEAVTTQTRKLKEKKRKLEAQIAENEKKRRQKLRQDKITDKEIKNIKELRQKFRKYHISLTDAESFKKYLENMEETGGNPKKFVELTKKFGSLKGRLTNLENQKKEKTIELKEIREEKKNHEIELSKLETRLAELRKEQSRREGKIEDLKMEESKQREKLESEFKRLAAFLKVKANAEEIYRVIKANEKRLIKLDAALSAKKGVLGEMQLTMQQLEERNQSLEEEIRDLLGVRDRTIKIKKALADSEQQQRILKNEIEIRRSKIALADTITNFLTRQPTYDFNRFYSLVETVKNIREGKTPLKPLLPRIEKDIRMEALKAFEGDLISKSDFKALWNHHEKLRREKKELREKNSKLENGLKEKEDELDNVKKENEQLKKVKVYVEGEQRTLKELEEWTKAICEKEIERIANGKFDKQASRTYALLNWVFEKASKKERSS